MLVTVTMLGIGLIPTGDGLWFAATATYLRHDEKLGIPARCFFQRLVSRDLSKRYLNDPVASSSMVVSLFVLASGYTTRVIKLSDKATAFSRLWLRTKPGLLLKKLRDTAVGNVIEPTFTTRSILWVLTYVLIETLHILLRAQYDIYESMLWEILWLAFALFWGTSRLFGTRTYSKDITENTWTFGQLFPVLLLLLPVVNRVHSRGS